MRLRCNTVTVLAIFIDRPRRSGGYGMDMIDMTVRMTALCLRLLWRCLNVYISRRNVMAAYDHVLIDHIFAPVMHLVSKR